MRNAYVRRLFATPVFWAAGALLSWGSAFASDPNVVVSVTPVPAVPYSVSGPLPSNPVPAPSADAPIGQVSVARSGLFTYLAIQVRITNNSVNTLNNVRFTGSTKVFQVPPVNPSPPPPVATLFSSQGVACQKDATGTTIDCPIGQLRGRGGASPTIMLVFNVPTLGDEIDFNWTAYYSEGSNDNPGTSSHTDTTIGTAYTRLLTTTSPEIRKSVQSYVPSVGGTFFTGIGAVATPADPFTTTVVVPGGIVATTAAINEFFEAAVFPCQPNDCFKTQLSVPGTFNHLVIYLRRDVTTFAPNAKIENSVINYIPDTGPTAGQTQQLHECTWTNPAGPAAHVPCINKRTVYTKKTAPSADWIGDWEFEIFALDNGRFSN